MTQIVNTDKNIANSSIPTSFGAAAKNHLIPALMLGGMIAVISADCFAADAVKATIVSDATQSIKTFLTGDVRQVIAVGMIMSGAFISLMKSSWVPIVGSGFGVAIFEVLMTIAGK